MEESRETKIQIHQAAIELKQLLFFHLFNESLYQSR